MDETSAKSLRLHEELQGKIEVVSRAKAETNEDLALLYTPLLYSTVFRRKPRLRH